MICPNCMNASMKEQSHLPAEEYGMPYVEGGWTKTYWCDQCDALVDVTFTPGASHPGTQDRTPDHP